MVKKIALDLRGKLNKQAKGLFSKTVDSSFVECAGLAGFDFIILDQEHGVAEASTLQNHIRAALLRGIAPIVRVSGNGSNEIGRALDLGAAGVQVPNINTADQARAVISAGKYSPQGRRGVCRFVPAAAFGQSSSKDYFHDANSTLVILQVEGVEGVHNLDDILDVEGFDVLFIGPYDLSQALGVPGDISSQRVMEKIKEISDKARRKSIHLGIFVDNLDYYNIFNQMGFSYISYSVDVDIFTKALKNLLIEMGSTS